MSETLSDDYKILQAQSDLIRKWLSETTEPFDDWDWDGNELSIFCGNEVEKYQFEALKNLIKYFNFTQQKCVH